MIVKVFLKNGKYFEYREEFKNCPFCGSDKTALLKSSRMSTDMATDKELDFSVRYRVRCECCYCCTATTRTALEAIELWNGRA